ncbi:MAG: hypothetical protein ACLR6J_06630 [Parabacteroides merdae]
MIPTEKNSRQAKRRDRHTGARNVIAGYWSPVSTAETVRDGVAPTLGIWDIWGMTVCSTSSDVSKSAILVTRKNTVRRIEEALVEHSSYLQLILYNNKSLLHCPRRPLTKDRLRKASDAPVS